MGIHSEKPHVDWLFLSYDKKTVCNHERPLTHSLPRTSKTDFIKSQDIETIRFEEIHKLESKLSLKKTLKNVDS